MNSFDRIFNPEGLIPPIVVGIILIVGLIIWDIYRRRVLSGALGNSRYQLLYGSADSGFYVDLDNFLGKSENVGRIMREFERTLLAEQRTHGPIDRLAFIENTAGPVGALTLKDLLSWKMDIPWVIVRLRKRVPELSLKGPSAHPEAGTRILKRGEKVLVVSDVGTTGTTILHAIQRIRDAGGTVEAATVMFDRGQSAKELLAKHGVRLLIVFAKKEELDILAPHRESAIRK